MSCQSAPGHDDMLSITSSSTLGATNCKSGEHIGQTRRGGSSTRCLSVV
ncbi:unnamed protein product, partial [Staurois parvus]